MTALSHTHFESLEDEVLKSVKNFGLDILHRARPKSDRWRVVDYGGLLIHLMTAEAREFYSLDKLHEDAPKIKWNAPAKKRRKAKAKPRRAGAKRSSRG